MTPEQKNELVGILSQISNLAGRAASILGVKSPPEELKLEGERSVPPKTRYLPAGWEKMSGPVRKSTRVLNNSPMMIRIGAFFGRKEDTLWTVADAVMLKDISPKENEVAGMEVYYSAEIPEKDDIRRRNLATLLGNWDGELDRARKYCKGLP